MMSQNRAADKDRLVAEIDHQGNVRAEIKTGQIMARLDDLEREMHYLHTENLRHIGAHEKGRSRAAVLVRKSRLRPAARQGGKGKGGEAGNGSAAKS